MQKNWSLVNMADTFFPNHPQLKSTVYGKNSSFILDITKLPFDLISDLIVTKNGRVKFHKIFVGACFKDYKPKNCSIEDLSSVL